MGKRNANPREGDPGLAEKALGKDFKPEVKDEKKSKRDEIEDKIPKKKLDLPEEPNKPDDTTFEKEKKTLEDGLTKLNEEFKAAADAINEKQSDKEEYNSARQVLRDDLDKAQKTVDDLFVEYNGIIAKIKEAKDIQRKAHAEFKDMSRGLGGDVDMGSEEAIDRRIRQLELEMSTQTLSLKAEKEKMKDIAALKRQKPKLQEKARKLEELERQKDESQQSKKPLQDQAEQVGEILAKAKKEKKEKAEALKKLREEREAKTGDVREQIDAKNAIRAKINEKRDAIRALRDAHKKVKDAHWDWKRACQKMKNDAWKAEEDLRWDLYRAADKKAELETGGEKPHFEETTLIEQCLDYCRQLTGEKKEVEKKEEKEIDFSAFGFPEGARVVQAKKDRDVNEGAIMVGRKGKALKQKNKGEKKTNIKHNAASFSLFKQIGVEAPLTTDQVADTIEALNKKMEVYADKIKEWEKKREQMRQEVAEAEAKTKETKEE